MPMRRVSPALTLVLLLTTLAAAQDKPSDGGSPPPDATRPVLVIDELVHDFGEVRPGQRLTWAFKLKNEGDADLLIQSVAPG